MCFFISSFGCVFHFHGFNGFLTKIHTVSILGSQRKHWLSIFFHSSSILTFFHPLWCQNRMHFHNRRIHCRMIYHSRCVSRCQTSCSIRNLRCNFALIYKIKSRLRSHSSRISNQCSRNSLRIIYSVSLHSAYNLVKSCFVFSSER